MKRTVVTPAALAPAALSELKDWLGISIPADDAQLGSLLRASLEMCEHFTGAMPLQQGCEEVLSVSADWQVLAAQPVQAIIGIDGLPADGPRFALPVSSYAVDLAADGSGSVRVSNPGSAGRIAVRFTAGLSADWASLPDGLRHGVLRLAAFQYRAREDSAAPGPLPPAAVAALWRPWRRLNAAFGPGAARLGGLAARLLGWRPPEFWRATPAELAAILAPYANDSQTLARDDLNRLMERDNAR